MLCCPAVLRWWEQGPPVDEEGFAGPSGQGQRPQGQRPWQEQRPVQGGPKSGEGLWRRPGEREAGGRMREEQLT